MKTNIYFWSQALDNTSPATVLTNDELITNTEARESIASKFANVSRGGSIVYKSEGVEVIMMASSFLLTADTCEKDERGRISCVSCLGEVPPTSKNDFIETVCAALIRFLTSNARTQSESCLASTKRALDELFQINFTRINRNRIITVSYTHLTLPTN